MGHVTILAGRVFWRSGTECGSESRAVSMEPRLSGNDVSGNDVTGNDVRAEMTSAEMTTETGSEVKNHFIHGGHLGFTKSIQSLLFWS